MNYLTELFCLLDDFCKKFEPEFQKKLISSPNSRQRKACISNAEIMTIWIHFHQIRYRHFKIYYLYQVKRILAKELPDMPSYNRFIELAQRVIVPLTVFLKTQMGQCTGISFVDSTALPVCHIRRAQSHSVFKDMAKHGKSSTGWFFGFKLHSVINHNGELVDIRLTPGNVNDRKPLKEMAASLWGTVVGDKGYLGKALAQWLQDTYAVRLITGNKKDMKQKDKSAFELGLLQKRCIIETVFDELKNLCQIQHTRHRSYNGFMLNLISGLVAYCLFPEKPSAQIGVDALPDCA